MAELRVFHNHQLVGTHDPRCEARATPEQEYYRYHEGNALVVVEAGKVTRYEAGEWSGAGVDLDCAFGNEVGVTGCLRCDPSLLGS